MIKRISIQGWKSFRSIKDFSPRPLNVLIGLNQSGKTNLIDFFQLLKDLMVRDQWQSVLARCGGLREIVHGKTEEGLSADLAFRTVGSRPERKFRYRLVIGGARNGGRIELEEISLPLQKPGDRVVFKREKADEDYDNVFIRRVDGEEKIKDNKDQSLAAFRWRDPVKLPRLADLKEYLADIQCYKVFNTKDGAPMRQPITLFSATGETSPTRLHPEGDNLANVLYHLQQEPKYREVYGFLKQSLGVCFPSFEDLYFPVDAGQGRVKLGWKEKGFQEGFTSIEVSDGTLKFLCLLAILLDPDPPPVVCLDEPEAGLHPRMISVVAELIEKASERMQLFVATHSPQFLSCFPPEDVVIVEKDGAGASGLKRLDAKGLQGWLEDFTLGDLWKMGKIGG